MTYTFVKSVRGKGRGVFAGKKIKAGTLIETCPVVLFNVVEGKSHMLEEYAFRWSPDKVALALGNGSLYNHSYKPNAYYVRDTKTKCLLVYAIDDISKDEEICFNYNGNPESQAPLWFKVKD